MMPDKVWFGFYIWVVSQSTPKGPHHDQGFTGQSFVQTHTKKPVCALESCNGNMQSWQKMAWETKARLDKITCVKQSKPCLPAHERYCQNLKKCHKLLWRIIYVLSLNSAFRCFRYGDQLSYKYLGFLCLWQDPRCMSECFWQHLTLGGRDLVSIS